MASTHSSGTLQASVSNTAGGTTTSTTLDLSTAYGAIVTAKITNGATAPTVACTVTLNVSPDGTNFYQWQQGTGNLTNAGVQPLGFQIPPEAIRANLVFTGNTGQAVTVEAQYQLLTGI